MDSKIVRHYVQSHKRLLLLDYDGTLVGFHTVPKKAVPTPRLLRVLTRLGEDPKNQVVIVSGRNREFLDQHFGDLPIAMSAEHGYLMRDRAGNWHTTRKQPADWKPRVRQYMEEANGKLPGAMVEEKASSLVWHYDGTGSKGATRAAELHRALEPHLNQLGVIAENGRKILEVRIAGVDKGRVATYWLNQAGWDFVLGAGDDTTDEALFVALPPDAISIKVRPGTSIAYHQVEDAESFITLLEALAR